MSVTLMGLCWRIEWPTVSMRLLALKLADCANDEGENIYPSVGRIERETGLGISTIRRDLAAMEECALLDVVEQVSGNRWLRSTTVRRFNTEKLRALAEVETKRGVYKASRLILKQVALDISDTKGRQKKVWAILKRPKEEGDEEFVATNPDDADPPLHALEGRQAAASPPRGGAPAKSAPPPPGGATNDRSSSGWTPPLHPIAGAPPPGGPKPLDNHKQNLPPYPRKRGMREAALETLIEDIRSNAERERVVDHLIAPAIRLRSFSAPNKRFALGQIADSAKGLSDEELADTLRRLTETRRQSVKQADFDDAVKATKDASRTEEIRKRHAFEEKRKAEQDPSGSIRKALADSLVQGDLGRRAAAEGWLVDLWNRVRETGALPGTTESIAEVIAKRDADLAQMESWSLSALHKRFVPTFKASREKEDARLRGLIGLAPTKEIAA